MCNLRPYATALAAVTTLFAATLTAGANPPPQVLALTGDPAPGGPVGAVFLEFGLPEINSPGQVVFAAAMEPGVGGVTEDGAIGLWVGAEALPPSPRVVGDAAVASVPGGFLEDLVGAPSIAEDGSVIAEYVLEVGPGGVTFNDDWGRWRFSAGGDAIVYREGDAPPGVDPEAEIDLAFGPNNRVGDSALRATLRVGQGGVTSATSSVAFTRLADGTTRFLGRAGFLAPGTPIGTFFQSVPVNDLNEQGRVVSRVRFREGFSGVDETNDEAIYSDRSGTFTLEYREGDHLPGGVVLSEPGVVKINNRNRLMFTSELPADPGGSPFNDEVLWTETDAGLQEAFRTGQPAPGTGTRPVVFLTATHWNDAGQIAFLGASAPGFPDWLFSDGGGGGLALVAEDGGIAPGVAGDVRFASDLSTRLFGNELTLNEAGRVAFTSALIGEGIDETNDTGLWAQDLSGVLRLIVREGDQLTVAPGDDRLVASWQFGGFNDNGQVAFTAGFTDGTSGVFLSDTAARHAGDFNADGLVDAADYTVWRDSVGESGTGLAADGNGDNVIDQADYNLWATQLGAGSTLDASATIPEPIALVLCLLGLTASAAGRSRHAALTRDGIPPLSALRTARPRC